MKRLLIPAIFAIGILVGALFTGSVHANPGTDAARTSLNDAMRHLAQLPPDPAGHLKGAILHTQQAAVELREYTKNAK